VLTPLDDYLIHQAPYTVDTVWTSDRNFYDRYYFGMNTLDGKVAMIIAFGLYPNVGVMDAFATVAVEGDDQGRRPQEIVGQREPQQDRAPLVQPPGRRLNAGDTRGADEG
jgi:hypothetical protein